MKKILTLALAASLTSNTVLAHSGTHSESVIANLAHIWTNFDHWGVALAILSLAVPATGFAIKRIAQGNQPR
jgi:hydrogenase/urease accessory protein HupE